MEAHPTRRRTITLAAAIITAVITLTGCSTTPAAPEATEAQLSALFTKDKADWEALNNSYQSCVVEWFAQHTGEDCYRDAKDLIAAAKTVIADYEAYQIPDNLTTDGDRTIAALQRVIDGDIIKACGSGDLPDADAPGCDTAIPDWVTKLDSLVQTLNNW